MNENDSKILAGLASLPELMVMLQRINERLDSIEKKLNHAPAAPAVSTRNKRFFTVRETAEELNVSTKTVYRLINRRFLKPSRALRTFRIPLKDIEDFLASTRCD